MNKCINCQKETNNPKFCSNKCCCQHNHIIIANNKRKPKKYINCLQCNRETTNPKFCSQSCSAKYNNSHGLIGCKGLKSYYCKKCNTLLYIGWQKGRNRKVCDQCKNNLNQPKNWSKITLGEQKKNRTLTNAHAHIRSLSRQIYKKSNKPQRCIKCGWGLHYEVCHIKPISSFDDSTTIAEINHIDNLVALCPNCHWAFDHGHLKL